MNAEKYFKEMYADIWQGHNLNKFEDYYAKDFEEMISTCNDNKNPVEISMKYDDLIQQAIWQKENYKNTILDIRKITEILESHLPVYFYSSSVDKKTNAIRHRYVCGIWRLNRDKKIDRVWAVVTPYYPV
jgi:mannosyltransferase OCH1-like enzyme